MTLKFYTSTDDEKTVNKNLSDYPGTLTNVQLKDDSSLLKPKFLLTYSSSLFDPNLGNTPNYLYCETWVRYYFIRDIIYSQQMVVLDCEIDPLMTYSQDLLEMDMFVARQGQKKYVPSGAEDSEPLANILLPDDFMPVQVNRDFQMIGDGSLKKANFEAIGRLTDGDFVLLVNGGYTGI